MDAKRLPLRLELGIEVRDGVKLFRGEVERGTQLLAHTEWNAHPTVAMNEGAHLLRWAREHEDELVVIESAPLAREAHSEAMRLFALAR